MEIKKVDKVFILDITEDELNILNTFVNFNEIDLELNIGENVITLKSVFGIYKYLKPIQYHNIHSLSLVTWFEKILDHYLE